MKGIKTEIEGLAKVLSKLDKLKKAMKNKILRKATTKGCQPIAKRAKQTAPVETGLLKQSIGYKIKTYKDSVVGVIGPRTGYGQVIDGEYRDPAKYAHLVEYGHNKDTPPHPFLRPAWDSSKDQVQDTMQSEIADGVKREVR